MKDNPSACWGVALTIMSNAPTSPIRCTLPKEFSQKTYYEKYQLAIPWLRKAADKGHPLATTGLGKVILEFKYDMDLDEREGMKFLAIASKMGDPNARDDLMKHSRFVQGIKSATDLIRDSNEKGEILFPFQIDLASELGSFVLSRINNSNMNLDSFNDLCKNLDLNEEDIGIAEIKR